MHDKSNRRLLDVDIPAQPDVLVKLSLLLAEDEVDLNAASLLISSDMALAAAVLKAVNSAMYGLRDLTRAEVSDRLLHALDAAA